MTRKALSATKRKEKANKKRTSKSKEPIKGELLPKEVSYDKLLAELPKKQQRFVQQYLLDPNGKQAAIRAKYSERSAEVQASQLLRNPKVFAVVEAGQKRLAELVKVQQYEIVREFRNLGFSDMRDFSKWGPDGVRLKDSKELTREQAACVAEVHQTITEAGGTLKFKLHNKIDALNALAKHLGMFPTRVEQGIVQVPVQFNIVIRPTRGQG